MRSMWRPTPDGGAKCRLGNAYLSITPNSGKWQYTVILRGRPTKTYLGLADTLEDAKRRAERWIMHKEIEKRRY